MKKLIAFDSWTDYSVHFERLVDDLSSHDYQLILIHIGSWGHDVGRPKEELIGKLLVRDISYYGKNSMLEILKKEAPKGVLFLSTRGIANIAVNRCAKYLGIPTCHIYHGLVMVQPHGHNDKNYSINFKRYIGLIIERVWKNISIIIPFYLKVLIQTKADFIAWVQLLMLISKRLLGISAGNKNPYVYGTQTDYGCVYVPADKLHMNYNYKVPNDNIYVVGNPDLITFGIQETDLASQLVNNKTSRTILYLDTALCEAGVVFNSKRQFLEHIIETRDKLLELNYNLIVKLHPAHFKTGLEDLVRKKGIQLCTNEDFVWCVKNSIAVITEPTTAAMVPALIGRPLLLTKYGILKNQSFGFVIESYPRAASLDSLYNIEEIVKKLNSENDEITMLRWIKENIGPLPASELPLRITNALIKMNRAE